MKKLITFIVFLFTGLVCFAQIAVKGTVKDTYGNPLPAAGVQIVGTSQGTTCDMDGNWSISVPDESSQLEVSFLGMLSKTISVGKDRIINVELKDDSIGLQEVVT